MNKGRAKKVGLIIIVGFILVLPPLVDDSAYYLGIVALFLVYAISASSLNLLTGIGGQVSIGNAGFLTIGAYSAAIMSSSLNMPFILSLVLSGIVTSFIGCLVGLPAVKLRGHFLALVTLGFGLSVPLVALNWSSLTSGYSGLGVSRPTLLEGDREYFYIMSLVSMGCIWMLHRIEKSRFGRAFRALRDSEIAAESVGVKVWSCKLLLFAIAAFFTGIAGGLYTFWMEFISPNDFTLFTSILLLGMIVVGGLGSSIGAVLGAAVFTIVEFLMEGASGATNMIIGVTIVLFIMLLPRGVAGIRFRSPAGKQESSR